MSEPSIKIAVIIPCYRVRSHILDVIIAIGPEVWRIYVVDDACPEQSGAMVEENGSDPRVRVIRHSANQGVGGAMVTGYRAAMEEGADILLKIDGDGQMDPSLIPRFVEPITSGRADYTKGNRFRRLKDLKRMPTIRLIGNSGLSFMVKLASGYWDLLDPTNGYTAIRATFIDGISLDSIAKRYFFEIDLLIRLNIARAAVEDIPMSAVYGDEQSSLKVHKVLLQFPPLIMLGFLKRIVLRYYVYDFNMASVYLLVGLPLFMFGFFFGAWEWYLTLTTGIPRPLGSIILATLPIIVGMEMLLQAIHIDISSVPRKRRD